MNNIQASRIVNNCIANLQLNNDFIIKIKNKLRNKEIINLKDVDKNHIAEEIMNYHLQEILNQYPEIKPYIKNKIFKSKLLKKYLYIFAQEEISNNVNIDDEINNLSFNSLDIDYHSAPIVVCREFFDNYQSYNDNIIYISQREYNPYDINELVQILKSNCVNLQGIFYVNYNIADEKFDLNDKTVLRLARKLL